MDNKKYLEQKRNRIKQFYRIRLGILQLIHKPIFAILLIPIAVMTILFWLEKDKFYSIFEIPKFLFPIYQYSINIIAVLIPLLTFLALLDFIGNLTARKEESALEEAFNTQQLRNGCPILINKKRIKGTNVTIREFYTSIPLKIWQENQDTICDCMNVHIVEKIRYGGRYNANGRRVIMRTAPSRKTKERSSLYDDEF